MANTDTSLTSLSNTQLNAVRVMLLFFAATEKWDKSSSAINTMAIHKEKIYIPLSEEHRELHRLENHLKTFTDLENIARSKGLGENPDFAIAGVQKEGTGLP